LTLSTQAKLAVIPMQDVLELDGTHRMNTPGTLESNWIWRFGWQQLTPHLKQQFAQAIQQSGRS